MKLKIFLVAIFSLINLNIDASAQKIASPLEPEIKPLRKQFGGAIGFGQNFQTGIFDVLCEKCHFEDGTGFGFTIGGLYQQEIFKNIWIGAMARYDLMSVTAAYKERESINFINEEKGIDEVVPILFRQEASAKFSYLSLMPYLNFTFFEFFFIRVSPMISLVLSGSSTQIQEPTDKWVLLSTGDTAYVEYDKSTTKVGDYDFPEINKLLFAVTAMAGFDIMLRHNISLSPVFEYSQALNNVSEFGTDFRINKWRILVELRFDIFTPIVKITPVE